MNVIDVIPPEVEPITFEEACAELRVDLIGGSSGTAANDEMIRRKIAAARRRIEQMTGRSYVRRRLRFITDILPHAWLGDRCGCWRMCSRQTRWGRLYVELPRSPVIEVHSVQYLDAPGGQLTTLEGWYCDMDEMPARLYTNGIPWPEGKSLRVEYTTGLGDSGSPSDFGATAVPPEIKEAMLFHLRAAYDAMTPDKAQQMDEAIRNLISDQIIYTL